MTYDLESIKKAFWQTFHMSGEWWFTNRPEEQERADRNTNAAWDEFKENLNTTTDNSQPYTKALAEIAKGNCPSGGWHNPIIETSMYGYAPDYVCSKCGVFLAKSNERDKLDIDDSQR